MTNLNHINGRNTYMHKIVRANTIDIEEPEASEHDKRLKIRKTIVKTQSETRNGWAKDVNVVPIELTKV